MHTYHLIFYCRLHGSYEALKYGTTLDCLSDLTGGIAESVNLKSSDEGGSNPPPPSNMTSVLHSMLKMTTLVTCKVASNTPDQVVKKDDPSNVPPQVLSNGIIVGDSYRVYALNKVHLVIVWRVNRKQSKNSFKIR